MVAMKSQKSQLEREAADAQRLLDARLTEDMQAGQTRKLPESQIKDLKDQLFQVQTELSRERQSQTMCCFWENTSSKLSRKSMPPSTSLNNYRKGQPNWMNDGW